MKQVNLTPLVLATVLGGLLASTQSLNSQSMAAGGEGKPVTQVLKELKESNLQLIQQQDATLKRLEEIQNQADQLRIFTRRT